MDPVRRINCARETKGLKPDAGAQGTVRMSLTGTSFGVFSTSSRRALKTKKTGRKKPEMFDDGCLVKWVRQGAG